MKFTAFLSALLIYTMVGGSAAAQNGNNGSIPRRNGLPADSLRTNIINSHESDTIKRTPPPPVPITTPPPVNPALPPSPGQQQTQQHPNHQ